jgi:glyoxylase-like metal-dependent hydrolase (beta-lactamase superfamily II)
MNASGGAAVAAHGDRLRSRSMIFAIGRRALRDGEVIDLGRRVRHIDTPHVPHNWEARVLYEESTGTLFCGDLFTHAGNGPALTEGDIVGPALAGEELFHATALSPVTASTIRRLAALEPRTLALMHGSSTQTRCSESLRALADAYEQLVRSAPWTN